MPLRAERSPGGRKARPTGWAFFLALSFLPAGGCAEREPVPAAASAEVVVSAASSLTAVMTELSALYSTDHPGVTLRNNFGASGTLEQQIRRGAGVDLFVSAANRQMDALAADGLIDAASRRVLAGNELVLVVPLQGDTLAGFPALATAAVERVAMGTPESVPAGEYGRAALRGMGLWEGVEAKVVFTTNVRQALTYAERGEVDAALVYRTDAAESERVRVVAAAPAGSHPPIVYPAALVAASESPAARAYLDFLSGPEAAAVFARHGFAPPPAAER